MEKKTIREKILCWTTLTVISSFLLVGCGEKETNGETAANSEEITTENVEGSLEGVSLKIGTSGLFAPFSYFDSDGKTLIGYDIDLVSELQGLLGFEMAGESYEVQDYAPLITSLTEDKLDLAVAALCATSERKNVVDFTDPYINSGMKVMINSVANTGIKGVDDLKGKKVAVEKGTASHTYASKNLSNSTIEPYDKITGAYEALVQNKVDALIQDAPNLTYYIKSNPETTLEVVGEEFNTDQAPYSIALSKDNPYTENFNVAVQVLKDNGVLDELAKKWTE